MGLFLGAERLAKSTLPAVSGRIFSRGKRGRAGAEILGNVPHAQWIFQQTIEYSLSRTICSKPCGFGRPDTQ